MVEQKTPVRMASDVVYKELRSQIISKKRAPGERLPEETLARELAVSRTPVREALRRLATEGLVDLMPNVGARLANPDRQEIIDTYEVREYLECMAARKAAQNITPAQAARLQKLIDEEESIFAEKDFDAYIEVNNRFHRTLAEASGNPVLADMVGNMLARTCVYMIFYESFFDMQTNPSLDEHRALLKALLAHDSNKAGELMKVHLMLSAAELKGNDGQLDGRQ